MSQTSDERERLFEQSKGFVGGLLGFCSAAVLALVVVDVRSTALIVALWCFALILPVLVVQLLDFYQEDRSRYNMGIGVENVFAVLMMRLPFVGVSALLAHMSHVLCFVFVVSSVVCWWLFSRPSAHADRDKKARVQSQAAPAKTLDSTNLDAER